MLPIEDNLPPPTTTMDLSKPGARKSLSKQILADIDEWCAEEYDDGHRTHLGTSLIGHDCDMYLWLIFRWVKHHKHTGRQQRLFQRGHLEEARFTEYLRGIGFEVQEYDNVELCWHAESDSYFYLPSSEINDNGLTKNGEPYTIVTGIEEHENKANAEMLVPPNKGELQLRISDCEGHFGGSLDGKALRAPAKYNLSSAIMFLLEYKTKGTGSGFTKLKEKGVKIVSFQHFVQMCIYGKKEGFKYAIYMSVNKNDDSLHIEVIELDERIADQYLKRAWDIVTSQIPPNRLSDNPQYQKCTWCDLKGVCHDGEPVEINCRSCKFAKAVENKQWACHKYGIIPEEYIKKGCKEHVSIVQV